ncbi:MAG: hypothetical protein EU547_00905 [Promethearchaeota archaeon]|nr:MAG: hypothetical protein EU547_00905 [Candidatus Lokiarchaeota archaeon]
MSDPETAIYKLMEKDPNIIAATVLQGKKEIIFQTDNWDITPDLDKLMSSWIGQNATFIKISGVKYSVLQSTEERLTATSVKGEGSIVGAKDDEHKIIAYVSPEGDMRGAMMDTARTLGEMSSKESYMDEDETLGDENPPKPQQSGVDSEVEWEVKSFLKWIKDSEGLAGYVKYYLQQNDERIISELSKVYNNIRNILGV